MRFAMFAICIAIRDTHDCRSNNKIRNDFNSIPLRFGSVYYFTFLFSCFYSFLFFFSSGSLTLSSSVSSDVCVYSTVALVSFVRLDFLVVTVYKSDFRQFFNIRLDYTHIRSNVNDIQCIRIQELQRFHQACNHKARMLFCIAASKIHISSNEKWL